MNNIFNLPTKEQFDVQNALLASIASKQDGGIAVKSWEDMQRIVRMGLGEKLFVVGDQFLANFDNNPFVWNIIGINEEKPTDPNFEYSLTLQPQDCIAEGMVSAPQALYYAEEGLPAGEHVFTLNNLQYKFITEQVIPDGGQVFISSWQGEEGYIPTKITTYDADRTTSIDSSLDVVPVEAETDTLTSINHHGRCRYGSNNYVESAIKQWLNSNEDVFSWVPQTIYDRPPTSSIYQSAGFLKRLDPELVAVLGSVEKKVARNTVTDDGGQDTFNDKVFLLSRVEVFGGTEGVTTGEQPYDFYANMAPSATTNAIAGRIKTLNNTAWDWWLRAAGVGYSHGVRRVRASGAVSDFGARGSRALSPACVII